MMLWKRDYRWKSEDSFAITEAAVVLPGPEKPRQPQLSQKSLHLADQYISITMIFIIIFPRGQFPLTYQNLMSRIRLLWKQCLVPLNLLPIMDMM